MKQGREDPRDPARTTSPGPGQSMGENSGLLGYVFMVLGVGVLVFCVVSIAGGHESSTIGAGAGLIGILLLATGSVWVAAGRRRPGGGWPG